MKCFARMYFSNCPAGGQGRKRNLGDVEAFLEFAVKKICHLQIVGGLRAYIYTIEITIYLIQRMV